MVAALPVQHLLNVIKESTNDEPPDLQKLAPGRMRLYSYYKPSLEAGIYGIQTKQKASVKGQDLYISNFRSKAADAKDDMTKDDKIIVPQTFEVVASQFNLDPDLINSYYPPDGHEDEGAILPHICFNDPHFPWERAAGTAPEMQGRIDDDPVLKKKRSMVPWIALVVFDPEELALTAEDIAALNVPGFFKKEAKSATGDTVGSDGKFETVSTATGDSKDGKSTDDVVEIDETKLPQSGAYPMMVKDYLGMPEESRVEYEHGYDESVEALAKKWLELKSSPDLTSIIFPKKKLLLDLFGKSPEFCKYLAHVRHIKTTGFPDAGIEQDGLYSLVMSHRTGPTKLEDPPGPPKTQIVHLISIEHLDSTLPEISKSANLDDRIGIVSLHSWIYTALPPNPVDFTDTMMNLVNTMQLLRPPNSSLDKLSGGSEAEQALYARLQNGYTITRWRTESGEETAAFNRGPLSPVSTSVTPTKNPGDWPVQSMTGKNYQILDPDTGLMDLSYSSAWQLGKLLAIGDGSFSSALARFRAFVTTSAASKTRKHANGTESKRAMANSVSSTVGLSKLLSEGGTTLPQRMILSSDEPLAVTQLRSPEIAPIFAGHIKSIAKNQTTAGNDGEIYNGVNVNGADNSDWALIHDWLYNKLFLMDIPCHYLFADATHTPPESLRFFHIDIAWLDAFIDGALSVANHFDPENDRVRNEIKDLFNHFLQTPVTTAGTNTGIVPQVPTWGFVLRSKLLKVMPDLRTTVTWKQGSKGYSICRLTRLDENTIFCLLDRRPQDVQTIEFTQPPHQQRFKAGYKIDVTGNLKIQAKHLYTENPPNGSGPHEMEWPSISGDEVRKWKSDAEVTDDGQQTQPEWYTNSTRCLVVKKMVTELNEQAQMVATDKNGNRKYDDKVPTSVVLGLELNDSSKYVLLSPPAEATAGTTFLTPQRQLWTGETPKLFDLGGSSKISQGDLLSEIPVRPAARLVAQPIRRAAVQPTPSVAVKLTGTQVTPSQPPLGPLAPSTRYTNSDMKTLPEAFRADAPQFFLTLHPDYKSAVPRPGRDWVYNPTDFIPTRTEFLVDLVFSLSHVAPLGLSSRLSQLREIAIDIPTTGAWKADKTIEPLIDTEHFDYDGSGVTMLSAAGQRFVPFLSKSDRYLTVRLIPRSSSAAPVMDLNKHKFPDPSFRLAEVRIADVKIKTSQWIKPKDPKKIWENAGSVSIWVREFYADGSTIRFKRQEIKGIIKRDVDKQGNPIPDFDINGNPVPMVS